jgi:hypothetical protein
MIFPETLCPAMFTQRHVKFAPEMISMSLLGNTALRPWSRRRMIFSCSALGLPLLSPKSSAAEPLSEMQSLRLTFADSLFYYSQMLDRVRTDAIIKAGDGLAGKLDHCSQTIRQLGDSLNTLKEVLSDGSRSAVWPLVQEHFASLSQELAYSQRTFRHAAASGDLENVASRHAALLVFLREVSAECDPTLRERIKPILQSMIAAIDAQEREMDEIQNASQMWSAKVHEIDAQIASCASDLDSAAEAIVHYTKTQDQSALGGAMRSLRDATATLGQLSTPELVPARDRADARQTLLSVLRAISRSLDLKDAVSARPIDWAGYTAEQETKLPGTNIYGSNNPLIKNVSAVVSKADYFTPKNTTQVLLCISLCLPIWISFPSDSDRDNRRHLIESTLELASYLRIGINAHRVGLVAGELVDAYPYVETQKQS